MSRDDRVAFGVERHGCDGRPVARGTGPASRVELTSAGVQRMPRGQDRVVLARVALRRAHVADAAVPMIVVVPMHEPGGPGSGLVEIGEALGGGIRAGLGRAD